MRTRLQPSRRPQRKRPPHPGKLNITLLSLHAHHLHFSNELAQRLDNPPVAAAADADDENRWCQLRNTVQYTALAVLGRARRQHQDWFDDNYAAISNLIAEKNRLNKAYVHRFTEDNEAVFYCSLHLVKQRLREIQDTWTACKAEEIHGYMDRNKWKNIFSAIKAVYGLQTKGTALFSAPTAVSYSLRTHEYYSEWTEHFRGILNCPSTISDATIARLLQMWTNADLDLLPFLLESIRVVQQLFSAKAPRSDAIPAEIYKHGGPQLMDNLTVLFQEMWRQGEVTQDFKGVTIVYLYRRKGDRQICDNNRNKPLAEHRREDLYSHSSQSSEQPFGVGSSDGKPVQLPPSSWNHGHNLRRPPTSGKVPGDADSPVRYVYESDDSLQHDESQRTVKNHAEIRLSREIHSDGA
nr:unnamed protein product [Spirometra erinaceieuropaei]